jgi:hypothetical protein
LRAIAKVMHGAVDISLSDTFRRGSGTLDFG